MEKEIIEIYHKGIDNNLACYKTCKIPKGVASIKILGYYFFLCLFNKYDNKSANKKSSKI